MDNRKKEGKWKWWIRGGHNLDQVGIKEVKSGYFGGLWGAKYITEKKFFRWNIGFSVPERIVHICENGSVIKIYSNGILVISEGFEFDGPSGPTFDTPQNLLPSLVHDALYELLRAGKLPQKHRKHADELMQTMMLELRTKHVKDKKFLVRLAAKPWYFTQTVRSKLYFWGLRLFAGFAAKPKK